MVQFIIIGKAPLQSIPPPELIALFPEMVQFIIVKDGVLEQLIPPPLLPAKFPEPAAGIEKAEQDAQEEQCISRIGDNGPQPVPVDR